MLAAIHFNHDLSIETDKVQDKSFERNLAAEFESYKSAMPEEPPHSGFGLRCVVTHLPRITAATLCDRTMVKSSRH